MAYGAVARRGGQYGRRSHGRVFSVDVQVSRDIGASTARQYYSQACVVKRGRYRANSRYGARTLRRCGTGAGRTPTAAGKRALRMLARNLK